LAKSCTLATAASLIVDKILSPQIKTAVLDTEPPPAELRLALMPAVPLIVEAAIAAIRSRGPDLGASESALERNLRVGLTDAVDRWFDTAAPAADTDLHFALGRAQARAGRSLDELMSFYRIAGQTMWRRLTEVGAAVGIEPKQLYRLAETGFGCVDELSTQAAAGFAEEHSHRSGASHSRRSELVRLLLSDPPVPRDALQAAAHAVGIELSPTLACFVGPAEQYDTFSRSARDHVVLGHRAGAFVGAMFDPDGPGRRRELAAAAERAGVQLALGPAVPVSEARSSLERARALLVLLQFGLLTAGPLAEADHHDVALLLSAEPQLAHDVACRRLAPLQAVRGETTRSNLALTLSAWLRSPGQRKTIAHALGVHPQTVGYRMTRLRELFGASLDDPDGRFELELALRVQPYAQLAGVGDRPESHGSGRTQGSLSNL
jgi:PucR-like helix-turn-helix protein